MPKQQNITVEGEIITADRNSIFKVQIQNNIMITCTISGKIRQKNIRLIVGDRVKIEMSPYDLTKGRITWKIKPAVSQDLTQ